MSQEQILATLQRAGFGDNIHLRSLGTTGNNRVLFAQSAERHFLVKQYFQHPDDPRNRFETERAFYTFLTDANIRSIPQPMGWHLEERLAVLEYVAGEKPSDATPELAQEAIGFLVEINRYRHSPGSTSLPPASESCFSIAEHFA